MAVLHEAIQRWPLMVRTCSRKLHVGNCGGICGRKPGGKPLMKSPSTTSMPCFAQDALQLRLSWSDQSQEIDISAAVIMTECAFADARAAAGATAGAWYRYMTTPRPSSATEEGERIIIRRIQDKHMIQCLMCVRGHLLLCEVSASLFVHAYWAIAVATNPSQVRQCHSLYRQGKDTRAVAVTVLCCRA